MQWSFYLKRASTVAFLFLSSCDQSNGIDFQTEWPEETKIDLGIHLADADFDTKIESAVPMLKNPPVRKPAQILANRPLRPFVADPQQLLGSDFALTKALLGVPALYNEAPPAKIWTYNAGFCRLNVYFYPALDSNDFRALAYEVTTGALGTGDAHTATAFQALSPEEQFLILETRTKNDRRCLAMLIASRDSREAR